MEKSCENCQCNRRGKCPKVGVVCDDWMEARRKKRLVGSEKRRRRKTAVFALHGDICHYCGEPLSEGTRTIDHKVPLRDCNDLPKHSKSRGQGKGWGLHNLLPSCIMCNHVKGDRPYAEFVAILSASNPPQAFQKDLCAAWNRKRQNRL